jgi:hypothetical protein
MQRLTDYCGILARQTGIGYLLLWAITCWAYYSTARSCFSALVI